VADQVGELGDVVGAEHDVDQIEPVEQRFPLLLRHAAGHRDDQVATLLLERPEPADRAHELVVGLLADAAGVQDDQVRAFGRIGRLIASRE